MSTGFKCEFYLVGGVHGIMIARQLDVSFLLTIGSAHQTNKQTNKSTEVDLINKIHSLWREE